MKQVLLKRIQLRNWKAKNLDVTFNDEVTKISAKNEVGKSSLQQAWNWVFSSYTTPTANKNSDLYDNRVELTPDTPEASVKVWITVDGLEYTVERTAKAKFKRPRGQAEYIKDSSDTYTTKVDDIELSATNFNDWVEANICSADDITFLLDGAFFSTLTVDDKVKARAVLERLVGEIKLDDYNGNYELIADKLKKYTPEMIREQATNQLRPVRKRFDEIPAVIESKTRLIADYDSEDWDGILKQIEDIKNDIDDIDASMLGRQSALKPLIDKRDAILSQISELKNKYAESKIAYDYKYKAEHRALVDRLVSADNENARILAENARKANTKSSTRTNLDIQVTLLNLEKASLSRFLEEVDDEKCKEFDNVNCSVCGQPLPEDKLAEAREAFNNSKNNRIEELLEIIDKKRKSIAELEAQKNKFEEVLNSDALTESETIDLAPLSADIDKYLRDTPKYEDTEDAKKMLLHIAELEKSIPEIDSSDSEQLTSQKKILIEKLESLNRTLGLRDKAKELRQDVANLIAEKKALACEMAHLEGVQAKCQEFIEERANIISDRVNCKLDGCKVVMFNIQKNGERTPDCVLTNNEGVRYATLSTSAKLRANIAIQKLFRTHYGVNTMTWVDEAAVFDSDSLPTPDGQVCYLFASDSPTLVVE